MTIKEAFAQAFDEAFVMDAMPGNDMPKNTLPQKPNAPSGLPKNAAAPSANASSDGDKTLSQHIQEGCDATKNGHPERCPYIKKMAKELEQSQGLDHATAMQQAIGMHTSEAEKVGQGVQQQQPQSPEMLEQQAQQIAQNPQMMEQIPSEMLPETKMVQTEAGELPAQTTVQEGILENLTEQAASGNTLAEESLQELKDKVEDGTITQSGEQQQTKVAGNEVNMGGEAGQPLDDSSLPPITPKPEPEMISTSDGKSSRNIEPYEAMVLAANPEKKEILQKMVDIKGMVGDLKEDSPQFKDLANQYQALQRLFFGNETGEFSIRPQDSIKGQTEDNPKNNESGDTTRKVAKKSDYIDALDKYHEAQSAYDTVFSKMQKDPAGTYHKYEEEIKAATKALDDARKAVSEFEKEDVVIVGEGGVEIDTGDNRRHWAEQERVIRNAGGEETGGGESSSEVEGEGGSAKSGPEKLCPICSTPLKVDGSCPKQDEPWHKEGKSGPDEDDSGSGGGGGGDDDGGDGDDGSDSGGEGGDGEEEGSEATSTSSESSSHYYNTPSPDDAKFRIGENKYKVNGIVYTDVSGKGLLGTMISAFMAGLRGEDIITGWDRISGTWDQMKRSASGENVRAGITQALSNIGLAEYADKVQNPVAKGKLDVIQEMFQNAKTPAQKMAAYNAFERWKKQYLGESSNGDSGEGKFSSEMIQNMDDVHKNGSVVTSDVVIGEDGKAKESSVDKNHALPTADIMGKPAWDNQAKIENLEEKKDKLKDFLENELGITVGDMKDTPSFNQTFITFKVDNSAQGRLVEKHIDDLMGAIGENASAVFDPKTKTVMVALDNQVKGDVTAKEIFGSSEWEEAKKTMACPLVIGRDMNGKPVIADMKKLVHLLVAGETGKGKSVAMNTILTSILMGTHPDDVKLVLIDPKGVEFGAYAKSKHNLLPIAETPEDSLSHIKWLENEVENRKNFLNEANKKFGQNFKDIDAYNKWAKANGQKTIPRIVCAIDELTELTAKAGPDFEERLKSLGNIARFTGINLIVATQHPTKKNIGGLKDNLPSRLAFSATNKEATQAILGHGTEIDKATGEKKLGTGDIHRSGEFLFETDSGGQIHGQGANTGEEDVERISAFWNDEEKSEDQEDSTDEESVVEGEVDGETLRKASPPKPDIGEGGDGGENSSDEQEEKKVEKLSDLDQSFNPTDVMSMKAYRDRLTEAINKLSNITVHGKKELEALEKKIAPFKEERAWLDGQIQDKFPDEAYQDIDKEEIENPDTSTETGHDGDEEGHSSPNVDNDSDEDSPAATMKDIEETFNAERERIEKALSKPNTKVRDKQKLREERKALKKRFNEAKAKFKAGGSAEDMLNIFEPEEEKPAGDGGTKTQEASTEPSDADKAEAARQEQAQKDEKLRSTVREQKFYNTPGFKATSKLPAKQIEQMENLLPAGWEFVTDNQFKAPARTKNGVVFIRHPTNGSYGRIFIKTDEKGKEYIEPEAQIDVDTTHPDYQGFVKNEDGTYSLTEEGKKAESEYKHVRKYSKNEKEREEVQKKFNRIRFGHDEAPDNMTIVANAVAKALEKL